MESLHADRPRHHLIRDYYIGFFDLVADAGATYPMDYDLRPSSDSLMQAESTDPTTYVPFPGGGGTIRGHGGGLGAGSVLLSWDLPCNDATVPDQDYAVYQGSFGAWSIYSSLSCTTGRQRSWLIDDPPAGTFWIVVPQNSVNEGSYGWATSGARPPAAAACRPQAIGACQ